MQALPASVTPGAAVRLRYRTADGGKLTRERVTVARAGAVVATWRRPLERARWSAVQSVRWTPTSAGRYTFCVRACDRAGNSRRDCAALR